MLAWPTGRPVLVHRVVDAGDPSSPRNSEWQLDSHAGTHIDAPLHWLPGAADVSEIPPAACIGPCVVVEVASEPLIEADDLPAHAMQDGGRVLFKTANSDRRLGTSRFDPAFVSLSVEAAQGLAAARLALVGIDYLSVESPGGDGTVHRVLLESGVVLLEGLDLRCIEPGQYNLSALPLRLAGGEASPVRAILWR